MSRFADVTRAVAWRSIHRFATNPQLLLPSLIFLLSGWVAAVAQVNPFTALVEGGRELISGGDVRTWLVYGVALALLACFAVWGVRGLRRAEAAG